MSVGHYGHLRTEFNGKTYEVHPGRSLRSPAAVYLRTKKGLRRVRVLPVAMEITRKANTEYRVAMKRHEKSVAEAKRRDGLWYWKLRAWLVQQIVRLHDAVRGPVA